MAVPPATPWAWRVKTMVAAMAPGPAMSGRAERDQSDTDLVDRGRFVALVGEELEGDEKQQQAARYLQGGHGDAQIVEDLLAEHGEHQDHGAGHGDRLPGQAMLDVRALALGEGQEDGNVAQRIHDHHEGDEDLYEEPPVEVLHHQPPEIR